MTDERTNKAFLGVGSKLDISSSTWLKLVLIKSPTNKDVLGMFWHEEIVKLVKYLLSKLHGDGQWVCCAICESCSDTVVVIQCDSCNTVELD